MRKSARMGPLAREPILFTDSMTDLEMSPTTNEKPTQTTPQNTVITLESMSCRSSGILPSSAKNCS